MVTSDSGTVGRFYLL